MDQPAAQHRVGELERFVGEWTMVAAPPGSPPWPGEARIRFEWIEGGAFLVERWSLDASGLPEGTPTGGLSVYVRDVKNGTYFPVYSDDRGVYRVYQMGLRDGEWTLRREGEPFAQRFTARFSPDGGTITGRWELREEGEEWKTDFDSTSARVSRGP